MKKKYFIILAILIIILLVAFFLLKDTFFPKIVFELNGNDYIKHNLNEEYHDLGFTLKKGNIDLSNEVVINSNVDPTKEGEYIITYTYQNQVLTRHVTVKLLNKFSLIGDEDVYLLLNGEYTDPKVEAVVNEVDSVKDVVINNNLNSSVAGEYKITYTLNDKTLERKIHVSNFDNYFKVIYANDAVKELTLKIEIDQNKITKYTLPDGKEMKANGEYKVSKNGEYIFVIYDEYNNKLDKKINIANIKKEPITATCTATAKDNKTTINVNANKKITKYIYNGTVSTKNTYTFNKTIKTNKVVLYDEDGQNKEITCTTKIIEPNELQIHFINADNMYDDAILIRSNKATIFIDGGRGVNSVVKYLKDLKVKTIDYVIGSHTEYDHIDAQGEVIRRFNVKHAIYPNDITSCGCRCEQIDVRRVLAALKEKKMTPKVQPVPSKLVIGDMTLYFIAPSKLICNKNNNSFVFILEYGENKFMFTGDSDSPLHDVNTLLANAKKAGLKNIKADFLKYPHHGNAITVDDKLIQASGFSMTVVPNAGSPEYPYTSARERFKKLGIKMYRQSDSKTGNILVLSDGKKISVKMDVKASTYAK